MGRKTINWLIEERHKMDDRLNTLEEVIEFLTNNRYDDIEVLPLAIDNYCGYMAKYLFNGKVCYAKIFGVPIKKAYTHHITTYHTNKDTAIITITIDDKTRCFKLDKTQNAVIEITNEMEAK